MRIKNISVTKLFDMFDYSLPLNLEKRTTIIIGPNGYGKTTILKMIHGIFTGNISILFKVPFKKFIIEFDDESKIQFDKQKKKKKNNVEVLDFWLSIELRDQEKQKINLIDIDFEKSVDYPIHLREIMNEEFIDETSWRILRSGKVFSNFDDNLRLFEKIYDSLSDEFRHGEFRNQRMHLPPHLRSKFGEKFRTILQVKQLLSVHFIQTQRLISYSSSERSERTEKETPVVKMYSIELIKHIETTLAQSSQKSQKLDSTFPRRVITKIPTPGTKDTYKKLLEELEFLRNKRIQLKNSGILIDLGDDLEIKDLNVDENRLDFLNGVLTEYINDTRDKLAIFDELAEKIELLKQIINERFKFKSLNVIKDKGFVFTTDDGKDISPELLSSGEQHELVMFYEFLFKVPKGSILLIDEPELSLHIEWQQKFLKDIINIAELAEFDVLIATHAPSIIDNFWPLAVDLGEVSNESYQ